ncbi:MAG: MBL fold metallo-hydrolase [Acidobacteriota bacterium]
MKIRIVALALLLISLPLAASAQAKLNVHKVAEGVWTADAEQGANIGWFLVSDGVVVVDGGNDTAIARAALEQIAATAAKPVRYLVLTHAHADHAGGIPVFAAAGAQIICHENSAAAAAYLLQSAPAAAGARTSPGVLAISERLVFFGASRRAAIYYLGPGHTQGDLVVLLPEDKILFSGDLVVNGRLPYLQSADADPRGWEQILARLGSLDVTTVLPGHGAAGTMQSVGDTLAYLRKVNALATDFIRTKVPDDLYEMKLREPDNRIQNVTVGPEHIANVRSAVKLERARLEKASTAPTPTPSPSAPKAATTKKS